MNIYNHCPVHLILKHFSSHSIQQEEGLTFAITEHVSKIKPYLEGLPNLPLEISLPHLELIEKIIPHVNFRYLVVFKDNIPVLFSYFQLFTLTYKNFNPKKSSGFVKGIIRFFLRIKKVTVLISGNVLRYDTKSLIYDNNILNGDKAAQILAEAVEKISYDESISAVILRGIETTTDSKSILVDSGYLSPWDDQVMEMLVEKKWTTITDYTTSLSRKYRARAKKILTVAKGLKVTILSIEEIEGLSAQINELFIQVVDKQPFVLTKPLSGYFCELKKLFGDSFEVTGVYLDGELVAFSSAFITETDYEIYYVGFDYTLNLEYQLYFNLLFLGLERSIILKKGLLKLGRTSFDAKANLGAKPRSLDYLIKFNNIPDFVHEWFICYFASMEDKKWKERSPLKNDSENASEKLSESYI